MRGLMILSFAALAVAAPQGYNYPSQQSSNQYFAPSGGSGFGNNGALGGYQQQQQPLISKRFFIHSAPEDHDDEVQHRDIVVGTPRKNFNVVFVKAPASSAQKTHIRVIPAVNEDKTVVYVLAKKAGENEITTHVEETSSTPTKPEVHFIKYKTNEEAEHAQRTIQADYDRLGGTSDVINEGVAPVSSVIGSLNGGGDGNGFGAGTGNGDANGFGAGVGNGFGSGAGNGFGSGAGNGFGAGAGNGFGAGAGNAFGAGAGNGLGASASNANGFGAGNGFGTGAGFGAGATLGVGAGFGASSAGGHGSANTAYLPPVKKH